MNTSGRFTIGKDITTMDFPGVDFIGAYESRDKDKPIGVIVD
jgi:hypothetical protein